MLLTGEINGLITYQVDINLENSLNEMITISAKGLKKKQGCKGRRRIKSCLEKPKKKKK